MEPISIYDIPNQIKDVLGNIKSLRFPQQGWTSDVAIIENERGQYVIKRAREVLYQSWLKREAYVLKLLVSGTTLPIPKIYSYVEEDEQNWILMEFIEGETMRDALEKEKKTSKKRELIFFFGKILSQIHTMNCPYELKTNGPWLEEMLYIAEVNLLNYEVDGTKELLKKLKLHQPKFHPQTLIHGDFTIDNVLVHNGKVTGIIDWSGELMAIQGMM